jgi:predicted RNA-binding protein Jag
MEPEVISLEEYKWGFNLMAKGSQNVKEKKGKIQRTDKEPEHILKVTIAATEDSVDAVLSDIINKVGNIVTITITKEGLEDDLKDEIQSISKIIARHGKQQPLDLHFDMEEAVQT